MRASSFCGVILAAGESSRMGRDKALLPWPPSHGVTGTDTFLAATIQGLRENTDMIIVVAGKNTAALEPIVYAQGGFIITNNAPELGQFSSLKLGIQDVLNRGRDAAIITLVDKPPVVSATVAGLRQEYMASADDVWAVVPEYEGEHGHPIVVGREMMTAFLNTPLTATARDVIHANEQHVRYVPVNDPHVTLNINTPEDYERLITAPTH